MVVLSGAADKDTCYVLRPASRWACLEKKLLGSGLIFACTTADETGEKHKNTILQHPCYLILVGYE